MALLTPQLSKRVANDLTMSAATASTGDTFANSGREMVLIVNGSGSPINVTIPTPATVDGDLPVADKVIAVGAGKHALLGPFARSTYNDGDGLVKFTCSSVTTVTVAVIARGA